MVSSHHGSPHSTDTLTSNNATMGSQSAIVLLMNGLNSRVNNALFDYEIWGRRFVNAWVHFFLLTLFFQTNSFVFCRPKPTLTLPKI
jgi:hypothetical protein